MQSAKPVSSEDQLRDAIDNPATKIIQIDGVIELQDTLTLRHPVQLVGLNPRSSGLRGQGCSALVVELADKSQLVTIDNLSIATAAQSSQQVGADLCTCRLDEHQRCAGVGCICAASGSGTGSGTGAAFADLDEGSTLIKADPPKVKAMFIVRGTAEATASTFTGTDFAIDVGDSAPHATRLSCTSCSLFSPGLAGLHAMNGAQVMLSDCMITATKSGVWAGSRARVEMTNSQIVSEAGFGLYSHDAAVFWAGLEHHRSAPGWRSEGVQLTPHEKEARRQLDHKYIRAEKGARGGLLCS